ncbi:hypothetical protein ACFX1X_012791 [Malus domestica]
MSERNTVSWTSLICGYARGNLVKEVVSLFFEMVMAGVEPNSVTTVCVISACAKLKDLELSERVCAYLGLIKCGDLKSAWQMFNEMPKSDLAEGIKGDRVTMVEVASACGYLGSLSCKVDPCLY